MSGPHDPLVRLAYWAIAVAKGELDPDSDPFDEDVQDPDDLVDADDVDDPDEG